MCKDKYFISIVEEIKEMIFGYREKWESVMPLYADDNFKYVSLAIVLT